MILGWCDPIDRRNGRISHFHYLSLEIMQPLKLDIKARWVWDAPVASLWLWWLLAMLHR